MDYDLIAIGSGTAGAGAATKCAKAGWKVAIVDSLPYGGTCALRGCDPKKILRRSAEIVDSARLLRGKGIDPAGISIDWPSLMEHKRDFTEPMSRRIESGLRATGVETLRGRASFSGPDRLEIDGRDVTARHVLIGTGARPRPLDIIGSEHAIDSTAFMDLDELPQRILFIGGGFISFEFAHIAARAGAHVTILTHGPRPLRGFDPDLVDILIHRSAELGIDIRMDTSVRAIHPTGTGYRAETGREGHGASLEADLIVHGAGREPDLADLNLDAAGVEHSRAGVTVADHLQSISNPRIYAAGDAADTPGMPLTPVSAIEAGVAASNMLKDGARVPDYTGIPTAVFTIPELARVGLLEHEAHDLGIDVEVRFHDTSGWFSNYRLGESAAATKILVDRATDRVVGAHMLGPEYAEVINIIGLGMKLGLTTGQLKSMTAAYPSVGSDLGHML